MTEDQRIEDGEFNARVPTTAGQPPMLPVIIRLTMAEGSHRRTESPRTSEPSNGVLLSSNEKPSFWARWSSVFNRQC